MIEPERLATMRKAKGLTQAEVAERIGVTQATVSRLESGARSPDPRTIERYIAAVDGTLPPYLRVEFPPDTTPEQYDAFTEQVIELAERFGLELDDDIHVTGRGIG
jgi:transcriptional regulator with XRE-family HTH domain